MQATAISSTADIHSLVQLRLGARELTFFPRMMASNPSAGNYRSQFRGRGMDFDEVRAYQPGDDIRAIDWRVTARTTTPHTKLYREERERPVLIVTDLRQAMFFGSKGMKSVTACQVAAALAWAGLQTNDRVGGLVFNPTGQHDIRARRSHHTVLKLIHTLSESSNNLLNYQNDIVIFSEITRDSRRVVPPGCSVFFISDFHDLDGDCESDLFELRRHADITFCHVYDDLETRLPPPNYYKVSNGGKPFILDTRNRENRDRYARQFKQRQANLRRICTANRIAYLQFATGQPVLHTLRSAYGRRQAKQVIR